MKGKRFSGRGLETAAAAGLVAAAMTLPFTGIATAAGLGLGAAVYIGATEVLGAARERRPWVGRSAALLEWRRVPAKAGRWGAAAVLAAGAVMPMLLNRYQTEVLTLALIYVTLALGLNYIVGLCGLLALGYIAFYAVGAYTYALLNVHYGVNFFAGLPIGAAAGGLAGLLIGLPVMRLRGDYLAIVTLGFGEIVRIVLNNWDEVTAGPNGIMGIARPAVFGLKLGTPMGYYYLAGLLALSAALMQSRLAASRIGRAWEAVREDELAAAHVGVPVVKMKLGAMTLGGAWAGAAGVLFAARMTHISPESFTFLESVMVLCMVVLGGMGSVPGVVLGAVVLVVAPELLRGMEAYRMLAFGLLMVLMMRFRRTGLIPGRRLKAGAVGTG